MEQVTEYCSKDEGFRTRLWVTPDGKKELEEVIDDEVAAMFVGRAEKGMKDYIADALRKEGDGVWAFGPSGQTGRICGYFVDESTRKNFVICGAWKGKSGKGKKRPHHAEAIVARAERIRAEGVDFPKGVTRVQKQTPTS